MDYWARKNEPGTVSISRAPVLLPIFENEWLRSGFEYLYVSQNGIIVIGGDSGNNWALTFLSGVPR